MKKYYKLFGKPAMYLVPAVVLLVMLIVIFAGSNGSFGSTANIRSYGGGGRDIKPAGDRPGKKVNLLLLGIERGERADAIMFISYDSSASKLQVVSIPRDTYYSQKGYERGDQRKINAVYGRYGEEGCVKAVSEILCGIKIDYYISIGYEGVEKIVDAVGGIEVQVPVDMQVGGITIPQGYRLLSGYEALQFMRFRKGYKDGDLGRIRAQHMLLKSAIDKIRLRDLPRIVSSSFTSIRTDMPIKRMNEYLLEFMEWGAEETDFYILPGFAMYKQIEGYNWSYFFHDTQKVKELVREIYGKESMEQIRRNRCR